jgi:hypothetical protein
MPSLWKEEQGQVMGEACLRLLVVHGDGTIKDIWVAVTWDAKKQIEAIAHNEKCFEKNKRHA